MERRVEPELADHIPADDPRAIRFRRDLKHLNAIVMTDRLVARMLRRACGGTAPRVIVDLGAGDGTLMLRVAQRLAPDWPNVTLLLVDQQPVVGADVRARFAALGWDVQPVVADVFDFLERQNRDVDIILANAFLHHFTADRLSRLFEAAARRASIVVACEPRRTRINREASRCLWLLGYGDVAIHDAVASVKAGFNGNEMTQCWPASGNWNVEEWDAGLFMHLFVATRAPKNPSGIAQSALMPGGGASS